MSPLLEVSAAVRTRRADMGLTQTALARLCGLSRATVNQVETAAIKDLSLMRVGRLLGVLGLSMTVSPPRPRNLGYSGVRTAARAVTGAAVRAASKMPALEMAARTASVSYRRVISADQLRQALLGGKISRPIEPHLGTLLDEAPVALLASVVEQLHREDGADRSPVWKRLRELAQTRQSLRDLRQ